MEVTATALLCLNTSSRLSYRGTTRSLRLADIAADMYDTIPVQHPCKVDVPVAGTACRDSMSTFSHRWKCWSGCWHFGFLPRSHSKLGAESSRRAQTEESDSTDSKEICKDADKALWELTVCAAADRGVLWTGVRLLLLLSHRTICPEYVPPTTRLGWNLANPADITSDWRNKMIQLVSFL